MRKRTLSLALCLCMVLSLMPIPAMAAEKHPFTDVTASDWFNDNVQYVYENNLMNGTTPTTFSPYRTTSRGMLVTILYRMEGEPFVSSSCPFPDVAKGRVFEKPITWAAENGIVTGYTTGNFGPDDNLTRQQMAAILYRYAGNKGYDISATADLSGYSDSSNISNYARTAMAWANANELINGTKDKELNPGGNATRAQAAAILTRFIENVLGENQHTDTGPQPTSYSVTFDLNYEGATTYQTVSVNEGERVIEPANPSRNNYSFLGWYTTATAQSGSVKFNFNTIITSTMTLYARWSRHSSSSGKSSTPSPVVRETYSVSFDSRGGSAVETQEIKSGEYATEPTNVLRTGYDFTGWYTEKNGGSEYDFSTPINDDKTLYAHWKLQKIEDTTDSNNNGLPDSLDQIMGLGTDHYDSDNDGIPDFYEEIFGTDNTKPDTDDDGLPDGFEMFRLGTSPLKSDTDSDGISDSDSDADNDGLTNLQEFEANTNPHYSDTDYDGLDDYNEVMVYNTNPLIKDTDNDGLQDWDELAFGMNPLKPSTLEDGILDGNRTYNVSLTGKQSDTGSVIPSVEMNVTGNQIKSLKIEKVDNDDTFLNDSIPGYLGNAYDFEVEGNFTNATLSFDLSNEVLSEVTNPAVFYWNEDTQTLEEIPNQALNGKTLSAELSHFSSYVVLDKDAYNASVLEFSIKAPTDEELQSNAFDLVFVLDESGSISGSDFSRMKSLSANLLEEMTDDDRIAVITFGSSVNLISGLTDKTNAAQRISSHTQSGGGTALYDAISRAIDELAEDTTNAKIIIALTDGDDNASQESASSVTQKAVDAGIIIYPVGVGSSVQTGVLSQIAQQTHGEYNSAANFSALDQVFERIVTDADLYKDSDDDGISDYHEKAIAYGQLKAGNGSAIPYASRLNYLSADSDNDGLRDDEELEILERTVNGETVYYCRLYSNPCLSDTDGDGLDDYTEVYAGFEPLINEADSKSSVTSSSASLMSDSGISGLLEINDFAEWVQLRADGHAPNYIHDMVKDDIAIRYGFESEYRIVLDNDVPDDVLKELTDLAKQAHQKKTAREGKEYGRVDLLNLDLEALSEIWDVKPSSYQKDPKKQWGETQLESYKQAAKYSAGDIVLLRVGGTDVLTPPRSGTHIESGHIPNVDGKGIQITDGYEVDYKDNGDGLIVYHFTKEDKPEEEKNPVPVPVPFPMSKADEGDSEQDNIQQRPVPGDNVIQFPVPEPVPTPSEQGDEEKPYAAFETLDEEEWYENRKRDDSGRHRIDWSSIEEGAQEFADGVTDVINDNPNAVVETVVLVVVVVFCLLLI